ncbi:hypothetical protein L1077_20195 [Pseudoalteromonas luteoviolacea]|uniref:hypothetical protein n=1 Tax=Pseudoalteromonas luteoviolacea TaxID=43657 RepID=UPI001F30B820|nr:hypothetical protein [Pseudoalteromonas luteoviolacea]MCF6441761.1 hypothetical protein [Pseudoalteromonas luteoviolacea]
MKLQLKKKAMKKLQSHPLPTKQTHKVAGGAQTGSPYYCPLTKPQWYCMSHIGCISFRPEMTC